jgi:hypothetical protein
MAGPKGGTVATILFCLGSAHPAFATDGELIVPTFQSAPLGEPPAGWEFAGLARQVKPRTQFEIVNDAGTHVLSVRSEKSYGNLAITGRRSLNLNSTISWRWKLQDPNLLADLRTRAGDDVPVRVCVSFDYDSDGLTFGQRTALQLARLNFPTPVPIATLCYVWDHLLPTGTELVNAYTDRIRYIVLESGEAKLHTWVSEKRTIITDFWKSFGPEFRPKAPDDLPELVGVLVGGDSDNTGLSTLALVGDIELGH